MRRNVMLTLMTAPLLAAAGAASAAPDAPIESLARQPWRIDALPVVMLFLLLVWYVLGAWQTRGPRGLVGRPENGPIPVGRRYLARWSETLCFLGGWTVLAIAFFSPLDTMARAMLSAHLLQHELMLQVAVPLMVLGRPRAALLRALPSPWAREFAWRAEESPTRGLAEVLTRPGVACIVHGVTLWFWLMPGPFETAMRHGLLHALEHLMLLGTALLFWWSILYGPHRPPRRGLVVLPLFITAVHRLVLGALIVCSGRLWYPSYQLTTQAWGFAPIEDQQLGAILLWVIPGITAILMTTALFTGWLRLPGMRPGRVPSDLVRMARPVAHGSRRPDSGAWQH